MANILEDFKLGCVLSLPLSVSCQTIPVSFDTSLALAFHI